MLDFSKVTERFDRLTNGELQEIVDLIGKGEKIDAWIKLGINPDELKEIKNESERATLLSNIANYLYNGKA